MKGGLLEQDFNDRNTGVDDWNLQLDQVIDIPFWQYIDREKIERQTQAFFVWLTERSGMERQTIEVKD